MIYDGLAMRFTVFGLHLLVTMFPRLILVSSCVSKATGSPNQPAAGKAGLAFLLTIEHHWPGLPIRIVRRLRPLSASGKMNA